MRAGLRAAGLDFMQLYEKTDGKWKLNEEVRPSGVLAVTPMDLSDQIDAELAADHLFLSDRGALAGAASIDARHTLVAGMVLPRDYFSAIERVRHGISFYRRFGVIRDVSRTYVLLLVTVLFLLLVGGAAWASAALAKGSRDHCSVWKRPWRVWRRAICAVGSSRAVRVRSALWARRSTS